MGLNPCSNGRCSARNLSSNVSAQVAEVLILVLMEDALRVLHNQSRDNVLKVLILVLMEDALRVLPVWLY